jgi:hypothetical protein
MAICGTMACAAARGLPCAPWGGRRPSRVRAAGPSRGFLGWRRRCGGARLRCPWAGGAIGRFALRRLAQAPCAQTGGREGHAGRRGRDDRRPGARGPGVVVCDGWPTPADRDPLCRRGALPEPGAAPRRRRLTMERGGGPRGPPGVCGLARQPGPCGGDRPPSRLGADAARGGGPM